MRSISPKRVLLLSGWSVVPLLFFSACSTNDFPPVASMGSSAGGNGVDARVDSTRPDAEDPPLDASSSDSPNGDATASACHDVQRAGPDVSEVRVAANPPPPGGGTVVPGTYFLTGWETYAGADSTAGPTGEVRRSTLVISGDVLRFATRDVEEALDLPVSAERFQTKTLEIDSVETCPLAGRPFTRGFTATPTTLTFFEPLGVITRKLLYSKQP
jgi:hypothetical protein